MSEKKMSTGIDTLTFSDEKEDIPIYKTPEEYVMDICIDSDLRITYLEKCSEESIFELVKRISGMYMFSKINVLEKYLYSIVTTANIPILIKLEAAKVLHSSSSSKSRKERGNEALNYICNHTDCKNIPTVCMLDIIYILMNSKTFKKNAMKHFKTIITNHIFNCDFRYKAVLTIESKVKESKPFIQEACLIMAEDESNEVLYRILACQNIEGADHILLSFAKDVNVPYNLRADAADALLSRGSDESKIEASSIIIELGFEGGGVKTIFNNAQNVHATEIEKSVQDIIESLINFKSDKNNKPKTYSIVKDEIEQYSKTLSFDTKLVTVSLNRIEMDRTLFSNCRCNLQTILIKIWSYTGQHDSIQEMRTRLLEELVEMAGTCSSGFASRLCNTISGFGEFNIRISWEDQIVANFAGRINARARDIVPPFPEDEAEWNKEIVDMFLVDTTNERLEHHVKCLFENKEDGGVFEQAFEQARDQILSSEPWIKEELRIVEQYLEDAIDKYSEDVINEMMLPPSSGYERRHFNKFFRDNFSLVRDEMWDEFEEYVDEQDFDLYFRKALQVYEGQV